MDKKQKRLRYYPLAINLSDKSVVVVGGGAVAERKVKSLLEARASVRVISLTATPALRRLVEDKKITWTRRFVKKSDVRDAFIIIAATNRTRTNKEISRWAKEHKSWVNVVDKPLLSGFISPAVLRTKEALLAVYTDGRNPVLSRDLKNFLKEHWDEFLRYRSRLQNHPA